MDNKLEVGSKVYVSRKPSNDTGSYKEVDGKYYYITKDDGTGDYCVWSNVNEIGDYIGWFSEEELTLVESKKIQPIIMNPTENTKEVDYIMAALEVIIKKDYEFSKELAKLITYLASTYADKYENTDNYSKRKLLSEDGKAANVFTALKYIQRYDTVGYSKSENPQDLLKAIHYCLFENQRKNKYGNSN